MYTVFIEKFIWIDSPTVRVIVYKDDKTTGSKGVYDILESWDNEEGRKKIASLIQKGFVGEGLSPEDVKIDPRHNKINLGRAQRLDTKLIKLMEAL